MNKVELLAPAGNLEKAKIALLYGADAVYIGGKSFSLRARASNFDLNDIKELSEYAHKMNKLVYVTMNIVPHDEDLEDLIEYLKKLSEYKIDAIITTSRTIMENAKIYAPNVQIHVSTQNSITNSKAIKYYENIGATRVVLAREVTLKEMKKIKKNTNLELEVFIHGGMCASYSGRCVLSNYMTNRDANRGGCAHSCRWNYKLYDNKKEIEKDFYFSMGSKDLMVLKHIKDLLKMNIASLKIEGRMKSTYYLATVVRSYRMLIDKYYETNDITTEDIIKAQEEIRKAENRQTSIGFYEGSPTINEQLYDTRSEHPTKEYVGVVLEYDKNNKRALIEQRNYFEENDDLEFFGPNLKNTKAKAKNLVDAKTLEKISVARHPLQLIYIDVDFNVSCNDMIRLVQK